MKKYQLEIRAEINEVDEYGRRVYPGGIQLSETVQLGAMGFLSMTEVLGEVHKALKRIKAENEDS